MVNTAKLGSVNMPKLLRNLSNRSRQVRDLVFQRDAIFSKSVGTKKMQMVVRELVEEEPQI